MGKDSINQNLYLGMAGERPLIKGIVKFLVF